MLRFVYSFFAKIEHCPFVRLVVPPALVRERKRRLALEKERVRQQLLEAHGSPLSFAWDPYKVWEWPEAPNDGWHFDRLTVKIPATDREYWASLSASRNPDRWIQLAYIQNWIIGPVRRNRRTVAIGHFVTDGDNTQSGMGSTLARAVFRELHKRYGVTRIEFHETDEKPGHASFFLRLGTTYQPASGSKARYWIWEYDQVDHYWQTGGGQSP